MRRFLLNVISNKVVAKIHTDLQVFTTYQEVFATFLVLTRSRMATQSNAWSVLTLNPELYARCTIIFNLYWDLLLPAPLHLIDTINEIWGTRRERRKNNHCGLISAIGKHPTSMCQIVNSVYLIDWDRKKIRQRRWLKWETSIIY
jgi:hypothetical protein